MNARTWLNDVREHADPHLSCILVANKVDLVGGPTSSRQREVTSAEAELWAKEENLEYIEASAKTGDNVNEAFAKAARAILSKIKQGLFDENKVSFLGLWVLQVYLYVLVLWCKEATKHEPTHFGDCPCEERVLLKNLPTLVLRLYFLPLILWLYILLCVLYFYTYQGRSKLGNWNLL